MNSWTRLIGLDIRPLALFLHQRGSAFADLLKRHLEDTKFLRAQFAEHFSHLPGMLSEGWTDEIAVRERVSCSVGACKTEEEEERICCSRKSYAQFASSAGLWLARI